MLRQHCSTVLTASSLRSLVWKRSLMRQWLLGVIRDFAVPCFVLAEALDDFKSNRGRACVLFTMQPMRMTLMGQLWPSSLIRVPQ